MAIYGLIRQVLLKVTPLIVQQHQDLSLRISQMLDEILPKKSGIAASPWCKTRMTPSSLEGSIRFRKVVAP